MHHKKKGGRAVVLAPHQLQQPSRLELLRGLPQDLRIEIVENEFRKDFTESEKAAIAQKLTPYFRCQSRQGQRTDLVQKPTLGADQPQVAHMRVSEKIGRVLGESSDTVKEAQQGFCKN